MILCNENFGSSFVGLLLYKILCHGGILSYLLATIVCFYDLYCLLLALDLYPIKTMKSLLIGQIPMGMLREMASKPFKVCVRKKK